MKNDMLTKKEIKFRKNYLDKIGHSINQNAGLNITNE